MASRRPASRARVRVENMVNAGPTVGAAEFAIVGDDPVARCARPAPAPSPPPRPGEAAVSIGADRPSSSVHRRSCQQQFREKEMSTSASSRSAAEPAGAGRSASERAGIGAASRARVKAADLVNALHYCRCCGICDRCHDPVARCARPAPAPSPPPRPGEADVSIGADRPSAIVRPKPKSRKRNRRRRSAATARPERVVLLTELHRRAPNRKSRKRNWRRRRRRPHHRIVRPAAAAPARPIEQVEQIRWHRAAQPRARALG